MKKRMSKVIELIRLRNKYKKDQELYIRDWTAFVKNNVGQLDYEVMKTSLELDYKSWYKCITKETLEKCLNILNEVYDVDNCNE